MLQVQIESPGVWPPVVWHKFTDVSEETTASIFSVEN
jgi:hypothetical protein